MMSLRCLPPRPSHRSDKFRVSYHCKGKQDVADVVFHVNGVLRDTDYRVSVAADRMSISWQRAISVCFTKKILQAIPKKGYSASSHRAVTYNDIAQEMQEKKVRPKHKLFWGAPQVVRIKGSVRALQPSSSVTTRSTTSTSTRKEGGTASATWSSSSR